MSPCQTCAEKARIRAKAMLRLRQKRQQQMLHQQRNGNARTTNIFVESLSRILPPKR